MALVLKSNRVFSGELVSDLRIYKKRVLADGGEIKNEKSLSDMFAFCRHNDLNANNLFSATSPTWGVKLSGGNVVKMYHLFDETGDMSVDSGAYPLKNKGGGVYGFTSSGSDVNKFAAIGNIGGHHLSYFATVNPTLNSTGYGFLTLMYSPNPSERGLLVTRDHNLNIFNFNGYGRSEIAGVADKNNVGCSINPITGLTAYQDGLIVASAPVSSLPTQYEFNVWLARSEVDGNWFGMKGDFYLNIIGSGLSQSQDKAISKLTSQFI
ncbi:hypothetical protein [Psychrobacter sp.]|uniref:hypothetical protein n=1 Tax=Psychrobacter sp. TaxID=56811 RepID=UPI002FDA0FCB